MGWGEPTTASDADRLARLRAELRQMAERWKVDGAEMADDDDREAGEALQWCGDRLLSLLG